MSKKEKSRPVRRAENRLGIAMSMYNIMCKVNKNNANAFTKPGSQKHW